MNAKPILLRRPQGGEFQSPANRKTTSSIWKRSSCLKLHFAAVALCTFSWFFLPPSEGLIVNGSIMGVTYLALGTMEARRESLWLSPLTIFFFFFAVEMGPATIYVGCGLSTDSWLPFSRWMIPAKDVAAGYMVSLAGMLAMHAGLETSRPRLIHAPLPTRQQKEFPFLAFGLLWLLGTIFTYHPSAVVHIGALGIIFQYGALAALLPLAFLDSHQLRISRTSHGILFASGTGGLLAASVASQNSSKMTVVLAFLPLAALLIQTKRYRKSLPFAAAALLFLYLALIAPAINKSRNIPTVRGMTTWDKVVQAAEMHSMLAGTEPPPQFLLEEFGNLMNRVFEAPSSTGFLVGEVARTGLLMGSSMRILEYAFIPRILWPEKPLVSRGAWFTTYLGMAARPEEATTSTGMTAFGEWYWNFGIMGELAGMFLIGTLQGGVWRLAGNYPFYEPLQMLLYVAAIVDVVMLPEASTVLVTAVALYVMFGTVLLFRKIATGHAPRPVVVSYAGSRVG